MGTSFPGITHSTAVIELPCEHEINTRGGLSGEKSGFDSRRPACFLCDTKVGDM